MSKSLSWPAAAGHRPISTWARHAAAGALRAASRSLARLARKLRAEGHPPRRTLPVVEFHSIHRDAGAPEGALYIDGEWVGYLPGITRL